MMTDARERFQAAALEAADRGWRVFPLRLKSFLSLSK